MSRDSFVHIGHWVHHSKPGGNYCDRTHGLKYQYLWHPTWTATHLDLQSSYNHREILVDGQWMRDDKKEYIFVNKEWIKMESKTC